MKYWKSFLEINFPTLVPIFCAFHGNSLFLKTFDLKVRKTTWKALFPWNVKQVLKGFREYYFYMTHLVINIKWLSNEMDTNLLFKLIIWRLTIEWNVCLFDVNDAGGGGWPKPIRKGKVAPMLSWAPRHEQVLGEWRYCSMHSWPRH
jgi:hypothetical protein